MGRLINEVYDFKLLGYICKIEVVYILKTYFNLGGLKMLWNKNKL